MVLKLLHWNILFKEKIEDIVKLLKEYQPDIVCFNELSKGLEFNGGIDTTKYVADKLGYDYFFHEGQIWTEDGKKVIGNGIFTGLPIINSSFDYTKVPESKEGIVEKRGSAYIEVEIKLNNDRLTIATDHLMYISKFIETAEKRKEVDRLIEIVRNNKNHYILTGDMNGSPTSYIIKNIESYLVSAGPSHEEKTAFTKELHDSAGWKTGFEWRLDYVFATKDIRVKSAKIIKTDYSDHLPILVELES